MTIVYSQSSSKHQLANLMRYLELTPDRSLSREANRGVNEAIVEAVATGILEAKLENGELIMTRI